MTEKLLDLPTARIYAQFTAVGEQDLEQGGEVVVVVGAQLGLVAKVIYFRADGPLQPGQEALDLLLLGFVHLDHLLGQERQQVMHYV